MINFIQFLRKYGELSFWIMAMVVLFFMNADSSSDSLCFFHRMGIDWCPGCGIGHSIHSALHLQFATSLKQHPLGIVAVLIIVNRIKQLFFLPKQLVS